MHWFSLKANRFVPFLFFPLPTFLGHLIHVIFMDNEGQANSIDNANSTTHMPEQNQRISNKALNVQVQLNINNRDVGRKCGVD